MGFAVGGSRAKLAINGSDVGYATGVSVSETMAQVPIEVLGDAYVKEHELVGVTVTITADFVRMRLDAAVTDSGSLQAKGVWPRGAGSTEEATLDLLAFQETPLTMEIFDDSSDQVLYKVEGVVPETRTWRIDRGSIMTTNATFRGIRQYDEVDA